MLRLRQTFPLLVCLLAAPLSHAQEVGPALPGAASDQPIGSRPSAFADAIPGLPAGSSWAGDGRGAAWPVGSGRVFAALGLGDGPANALYHVVGPDYASPAVHGPLALELADIEPAGSAHVARLLGTGFVESEELVDGLALRTLSFAPLASRRIVRLVEVTELDGRARADLRLRLTGNDLRVVGDGFGLADLAPGSAVVRLGDAAPSAGSSVPELGFRLAAGGRFRTVSEIAFATGSEPLPTRLDWDAACRLAATDLAGWRARLAGATTVDTDLARFRDLCRDHLVHTLTMTCAETGVVVPMLGRRVASIREQVGATLTLLRFGLHAEARRALEWFEAAAAATGEIREEYPLDLRSDGAGVPWQDVQLHPAAEVPSWLLLQFFWYWRSTRDATFVEQHWPLIDVCLKRQVRGADSLMTFSGNEPWLHGLAPFADPGNTALVGDAPAAGRASWSFVSGVLFLMTVQAVGDMVDGLDRHRNPDKYAGDGPTKRPGEAYTRRSFQLLEDLEKRYWLADEGRFAPAISPVDGTPHRLPLAGANLMPLWVGWTFPTGEKSRDNLRNTCEWLADGRAGVRSSPLDEVRCGDLDAMLLVALSERDGVGRSAVFDRILASATPSGGFARWLDADSRPVATPGDPAGRPELLSPGVSGVVVDALLFATTGVRYAAVPNWDDDDIRLELRAPTGASYVTVRNIRKDGRRLDLYFRRTASRMTDEELQANEQLPAEQRRDPTEPQPRTAFVVDLLEGDPARGYYDVAVNAEGTVFVRYLKREAPASADEPDLRRIDEQVFVTPDKEVFLPLDGRAPARSSTPRALDLREGTAIAVLTNRSTGLFTGENLFVFDTGRPFVLEDLRRLLLAEDGTRRVDRLFLDWHYDAGLPASPTPPSRFAGSAWRTLCDAFLAAGGSIDRPGFATAATAVLADGTERMLRADEGLPLPPGTRVVELELPAGSLGPAGDAVLRVGTPFGYSLSWNGDQVLEAQGRGRTIPDSDAVLVRVQGGAATVRFAFRQPTETASRLFVRVSDADGMPRR